MIKEDTKYTIPFYEYDFELYKDMLLADIFMELIERTKKGEITRTEQMEQMDSLEIIRNKPKEELVKDYKNPWQYYIDVFCIDEDTDRYIYDEYLVSDKDKRLLKVNPKKKIDDIANLVNKIKNGEAKEYQPNVFIKEYDFRNGADILSKLKGSGI